MSFVSNRCGGNNARQPRRCRGTVLFIVTIVIGLVTLAAIGFTMAMRSDNMAAHLQADQSQVQHVGSSAVDYLIELSSMSRSERHAWGGFDRNARLFQDIRVDWDTVGERHGRFCIVSPNFQDSSNIPTFEFSLHPTNAKLSLWSLMRWERMTPGLGRSRLMGLPGMTPDLADSILDWLDGDDEKREFGAESEFYRQKDPPRDAQNTLPNHISELRAVRGVNPFTLLGHQDGIFHVLSVSDGGLSVLPSAGTGNPSLGSSRLASGGAQSSGQRWQVDAPPWANYLTAHSAQRNESFSGQPRIHLNQPSLRKLYSQLQTAFGPEVASFVVAVRRYGSSGESNGDTSSSTPPASVQFGSPSHRFASVFDLIDTVVAVPDRSGDESKRYKSPFDSSNAAALARFTQFADQVSVLRATRVYGQIDIMHASPLVLELIPYFTKELADRIVQARDENTMDGSPRIHVAWLLEEQLLDIDTMRLVAPFITVGGDTFEAQIVAMYDARSPWFRAEVVVDGTRSTDQTVYYRDLRRLGRGFDFANLIPPPSVSAASASIGPAMGELDTAGFQIPPTSNSLSGSSAAR